MVIWFELPGFRFIRVRVNGFILYSVQNFKLYSVRSFNTEPSSVKELHDHLTVQRMSIKPWYAIILAGHIKLNRCFDLMKVNGLTYNLCNNLNTFESAQIYLSLLSKAPEFNVILQWSGSYHHNCQRFMHANSYGEEQELKQGPWPYLHVVRPGLCKKEA